MPTEAKNLTFKHFINYVLGYKKRNEEDWERARITAFYSVVPHQGKRRTIKKPSDLFRLPSEEQERKEEFEKGQKTFKRYLEKYG